MRGELSIYDVSPFIYCGMSVDRYKGRYLHGLPIGGILYLMKFISSDIAGGRDVVLAFDSRSFRKDISTAYKKHRVPRNEIYAQLDLLYEILPKCGIVSYKIPGYEADDLIYNLVERHKGEYNKIIISGTDYDLTHNITSPKVEFFSISSQVNSIQWINFSKSIVKNVDILFNTISAYKVFTGDSSDGIPNFTTCRTNIKGIDLYNKYKEVIQGQENPLPIEVIRSRALLEKYISILGANLDDEDRKELSKRMDLVFPAKIDKDFSNVTYYNRLDKSNLQEFLSVLDDKVSLRSINCYYKSPSELLVKKVKELGHSFITGEYAVDKNRSVRDIIVNTEVVNLKEF